MIKSWALESILGCEAAGPLEADRRDSAQRLRAAAEDTRGHMEAAFKVRLKVKASLRQHEAA